MKVGDLVFVHYGDTPELRNVKPTPWFRESVDSMKPMVFLEWRPTGGVSEEGWATLLHPDGTKKIIHCDYFTRIEKTNESR